MAKAREYPNGYAIEDMRFHKRHKCIYCDLDFLASDVHWLLLSEDHIVPSRAKELWPSHPELLAWIEGRDNKVLCCAGCNHALQMDVSASEPMPLTFTDFLSLRDRMLKRKHEAAGAGVASERASLAVVCIEFGYEPNDEIAALCSRSEQSSA